MILWNWTVLLGSFAMCFGQEPLLRWIAVLFLSRLCLYPMFELQGKLDNSST